MIVAHRGACRDAPENTVPAFRLAWEQGADAIEGDFHMTRDGDIVCIHDDHTGRVSNTNLVVRESTLSELRALDVGRCRGKSFKGTVIPTLAEVLSTVPDGKTVYMEIKCGIEIIPPLREQVRMSGLNARQAVMLCFNENVLRELKAAEPQCKALWLCTFKTDLSGKTTPELETVISTLARIRAEGLSSDMSIPEPFIAALRQRGYEWHVWTIDDPQAARRMRKLGAASITSNVPGCLRKALAE